MFEWVLAFGMGSGLHNRHWGSGNSFTFMIITSGAGRKQDV